MKKLLAAVDFSEASMPAARMAVELAARLDAQVTLLHVYHPWGDLFDPPGYRERVRPSLLGKLDEMASSLGSTARIQTALEEGRPAAAVIHFARCWRYDLIVIGTHGAGRAPRVLPGSTAERVVRTASVPVLVVPSPGAEGMQEPTGSQ